MGDEVVAHDATRGFLEAADLRNPGVLRFWDASHVSLNDSAAIEVRVENAVIGVHGECS